MYVNHVNDHETITANIINYNGQTNNNNNNSHTALKTCERKLSSLKQETLSKQIVLMHHT